MLLNGVLMSALVARLRKTVAASTKPPGVMLTPLYLMVLGPSSAAFSAWASLLATVVLRTAVLAFKPLTVVRSVAVGVLGSTEELTASTAVVLASAGRAVAASSASRAWTIFRSTLANSSFST